MHTQGPKLRPSAAQTWAPEQPVTLAHAWLVPGTQRGASFGGELLDGEAFDGEAFDGEALGGEAFGGEAFGGGAFGGGALGGEALGGEALDGEAFGGEALGDEALSGEAFDGEALALGSGSCGGTFGSAPNSGVAWRQRTVALERTTSSS